MKIRLDFVTNSSSSSFIIAMKVGTKKKDIKKVLSEYSKELECAADEYNEWCSSKEKIRSPVNTLTNYIMGFTPDMTIDDWNIYAGTESNEGDFPSMAFYELPKIDTEFFKKSYGDK